jgi:4-amino-4-deoxy-L-arabinose transferase-like glycosyltransferase
MHGRIFDIVADTHCICFAQGQYQEILYAATIVLFGLPAAKVVSWAGLLLTIGAIFAFALEFYRSRLTGLVASLLFASTPIVAWSASTASNDLAQASFALLAVFAFLRWRDDRRLSWLVTSGIFSGYDLGIKPFGMALTLVIGVLVAAIAVRERGINYGARTLAPFALGAFLVALPAIIRSYLMTGDPLFPTITALVHGGRWWWWVQDTIGAFPRRSLLDFLTLPWGMTVDTLRYRDVIGPAYLFALPFVSVGFFTLRVPKFERWIVAILLLWLLLWYPLAPEARYGESILPLVALLVASFSLRVAGDSKSLFAAPAVKATFLAILVAMTVLNTQLLVPFQRNSYNSGSEGLEFISWTTLYENVPDREFELQSLPMLRFIDDHLDPAKDKVLDAAGVSAYGLYSDVDLVDGTRWNLHHEWDLVSSDAYEHLQEEHIDYVVTFEGYLPLLERAPVFHHLRLVYKTEPTAETGPAQLLWEVQ